MIIELELKIDLVKEFTGLMTWVQTYFLRWNNLLEAVLILLFLLAAWLVSKKVKPSVKGTVRKIPGLSERKANRLVDEVLTIGLWLGFVLGYLLFATPLLWPVSLTSIIGNLLTAWFVIKVVSLLLPGEGFLVHGISYFVWTVAVLNILDLYDPAVEMLDNIVFAGGNISISLLTIIKSILIFSVLFWLSDRLHLLIKERIQKKTDFTPSVKLLIYKTTRILLIIVVIFITLGSLGVELSAFAFLGGAVGVGVGFGLQKIVSNYVSGIIILLDKSIKPGDVIEIDDVFGEVHSQKTRFVSVVTRGGKEYLIPNEKFITQQVINWSYSDEKVRVNVPIGVSYCSDLREVEELILQAAKETKRVLNTPQPACLLKEFGESTVDFELRFWIRDPGRGVANVRSEVLFSVWDKFADKEVEIAFPQLDLHLDSISSEAAAKLSKLAAEDSEK